MSKSTKKHGRYIVKEYFVIEFLDEEYTDRLFESIPETWFTDETRTQCYWPPKCGTKSIMQRAINCDRPDETWNEYDCKVVSGGYPTYATAFKVVRDKCAKRYNTSSAEDHIEEDKFRRQHPVLALKDKRNFEQVFSKPVSKDIIDGDDMCNRKENELDEVINSQSVAESVNILSGNGSGKDLPETRDCSEDRTRVIVKHVNQSNEDKKKQAKMNFNSKKNTVNSQENSNRSVVDEQRSSRPATDCSHSRSKSLRLSSNLSSKRSQSRSKSCRSGSNNSRSRSNSFRSRSNSSQSRPNSYRSQSKDSRSKSTRSRSGSQSSRRSNSSRSRSNSYRSRSKDSRSKSKRSRSGSKSSRRTNSSRSRSKMSRSRSRSPRTRHPRRKVLRSKTTSEKRVSMNYSKSKLNTRSPPHRNLLNEREKAQLHQKSGKNSELIKKGSQKNSSSGRNKMKEKSVSKERSYHQSLASDFEFGSCTNNRNGLKILANRTAVRRSRSNSTSRNSIYSKQRSCSSGSQIDYSTLNESFQLSEQPSEQQEAGRFDSKVNLLLKLMEKCNERQIEQDRRLNRMEVTMNKMFILMSDLTNGRARQMEHGVDLMPSREMIAESEDEFESPRLPIMRLQELFNLQKDLKDKRYWNFLVVKERDFCTPSQFATVSSTITKYLKRFISVDARCQLTLKEKSESGYTLMENCLRVYNLLIDILRAGYRLRKKYLTRDEAHTALRTVWGRSKQMHNVDVAKKTKVKRLQDRSKALNRHHKH